MASKSWLQLRTGLTWLAEVRGFKGGSAIISSPLADGGRSSAIGQAKGHVAFRSPVTQNRIPPSVVLSRGKNR